MALTLDLSISTQTAYSSGSSGLVPLRATASPYAGSPVGALPGMVGNLVMDSTTGHLWACTSSGSSGSTVWEPVIVDSQLTDGSLSPTFKALAVTGADTVLTPTNSPSSSGGITLTAAMLDNGVVVRSGPTAAFTDTLDTAANIITYLDVTAGTGQGFRFVYVNTTAFVATIAAGTGITIVGPATVDGNSVREFVVVQTGATAFSFYALGQGSSGPAVTNGGLTQLGQVLNVAPMAANNNFDASTGSATTATLTAPCKGQAIVIASFSSGDGSLNDTGVTASLAGLVAVMDPNNGNYFNQSVWYLPMTAGQSSTFTANFSQATSGAATVTVIAFFQPTP